MSSTYRKLSVVTKSTDFATATKLVSVPLVAPEPNQIRVRQLFAGVNATDINFTAGRYLPPDTPVPFDCGFEALGVVDAIGSAVRPDTFKVGQPVLVFDQVLTRQTGYAEYSYKTPECLIPVPALDPKYLVALTGLTAAVGLDEVGRVKAGDLVLVTAAAGGTGQIVVQWAKHRGAKVVALTSSAEKAKYLKEQLKADYVINYREQNLDQVLTEQFPNGLDVIWETVGGETFSILFKHLAEKGRLVVVGTITNYKDQTVGPPAIPHLNSVLLSGAKTVSGFKLLSYLDKAFEALPSVLSMVHEGKLSVQVDQGERSKPAGGGGVFRGLEHAARANEWLHASKNLGKVVVRIQ